MKYFLLIFFSIIATCTFCQKKKSIGIDVVHISSLTKNQAKKSLFNTAIALQATYRKNIIGTNYLCIAFANTLNSTNSLQLQKLTVGYESEMQFLSLNKFFIKSDFSVYRFYNKSNSDNSMSVGLSLEFGANIKLFNKCFLRPSHSVNLLLPGNITSFLDNISLGTFIEL